MAKNDKLDLAVREKQKIKKISKERRKAIAKMGAEKRWRGVVDDLIPSYTGNLRIGDLSVPCAVLKNGERVISRRGLTTLIGRTPGGPQYKNEAYINKNLIDYVTSDMKSIMDNPIEYKIGKAIYYGLKAEIIPKFCELYLKARDDKALTRVQEKVAVQADIIMRSLAQVGITALIDEATGYQETRDRDELQKILEKYLSKEFSVWAKRIPDEFYQHIFRLKGWKWKGMHINRPQIVAKYTTDAIYARLAPGVLDELNKKNPVINGYRKKKHHQWLTEDIGHPKLAEHTYAVLVLMRSSETWNDFIKMMDRSLPRKEETLSMITKKDVYFSIDQEDKLKDEMAEEKS